jgi:hypothetical protein
MSVLVGKMQASYTKIERAACELQNAGLNRGGYLKRSRKPPAAPIFPPQQAKS